MDTGHLFSDLYQRKDLEMICSTVHLFSNYLSILQISIEAIENMRTVAALTIEDTFYKNYVKETKIPYK